MEMTVTTGMGYVPASQMRAEDTPDWPGADRCDLQPRSSGFLPG